MFLRSSLPAIMVLTLLATGCESPEGTGVQEGAAPISLSDFLSEALDAPGTIGEFSGDGPAVLGEVRMVRAIDEETVLILDRYEPFLRRFIRTEDGQWRFDAAGGRTGQGPGEARDVTTFFVSETGTTYLLHDLYRITVFDPNLIPAGSVYRAGFPLWGVAEVGEGRILALGPHPIPNRHTVAWARIIDLREGETLTEFRDPMPAAARRVPSLRATARDAAGRPGVLHFGSGGPTFLRYDSESNSIVARPLPELGPVAQFQPLASDPGAPPDTPESHRRLQSFTGMLWLSGDRHLWTERTVAAPLEDPTAITRPTVFTGYQDGEWRRLVLPESYSVHLGASPGQALIYTDDPYPRVAVVSAEALFRAFWSSAKPLEIEAAPPPGEIEFESETGPPPTGDRS
jgi:hypothetical protein